MLSISLFEECRAKQAKRHSATISGDDQIILNRPLTRTWYDSRNKLHMNWNFCCVLSCSFWYVCYLCGFSLPVDCVRVMLLLLFLFLFFFFFISFCYAHITIFAIISFALFEPQTIAHKTILIKCYKATRMRLIQRSFANLWTHERIRCRWRRRSHANEENDAYNVQCVYELN